MSQKGHLGKGNKINKLAFDQLGQTPPRTVGQQVELI